MRRAFLPLLAAAACIAAAPAPADDFRLFGKLEQGGVAYGTAPAGTVGLSLGGQPVAFDPSGRFLLGFDRDAPASVVLEARTSAGAVFARTLRIAPHAWSIERVDVPKRPSVTDEEFERLRAPEVARIAAARAINAQSDGWQQHFVWPAKGRISGVFGSQRIYRGGEPGAYHAGVDIAGGAGAPVTAPADGVVVLAADKPFTLEGDLLIVDHGMGLNSAFLHLSRIDVKEGERVKKGQTLGAIGSTGRATGPHLHWALKWRDTRIDPTALVGSMPN